MQSRASSTSGLASPFAQVAGQADEQHGQPERPAAPRKPGLLGRLCACGQKPAAQEPEQERDMPSGQSLETTSRSTSGQHGIRVRQPLTVVIRTGTRLAAHVTVRSRPLSRTPLTVWIERLWM